MDSGTFADDGVVGRWNAPEATTTLRAAIEVSPTPSSNDPPRSRIAETSAPNCTGASTVAAYSREIS